MVKESERKHEYSWAAKSGRKQLLWRSRKIGDLIGNYFMWTAVQWQYIRKDKGARIKSFFHRKSRKSPCYPLI